MPPLENKTLFIIGAGRGIGKAIAPRASRDGANIVISAKTSQPHPRLEGTVYAACEEIAVSGEKCLPCVVDIRFDDQVENALSDAAEKFGGIDILMNNAGALAPLGTLMTCRTRTIQKLTKANCCRICFYDFDQIKPHAPRLCGRHQARR